MLLHWGLGDRSWVGSLKLFLLRGQTEMLTIAGIGRNRLGRSFQALLGADGIVLCSWDGRLEGQVDP